ncbi:hypothetical protein [uncultured Maricaulis sp.]|uniref:hypothetical protein n=1 Tax=uncultured Maricaulis sp. TaxID=174710 RepID=UPI0030DC1619|tara:strand:- start:613 stop:1008 length:396 start_codon:yes stop_codon:yes gene_type:complete
MNNISLRCSVMFAQRLSGCSEARGRIVDIQQLLEMPGIAGLLELAPVVGGAIWALLTALLWRNGFGDLFERFTRSRWSTAQRAATVLMIPGRALLLTLAAGLGAGLTTLGLLINLAVLLNLWRAGKLLIAG